MRRSHYPDSGSSSNPYLTTYASSYRTLTSANSPSSTLNGYSSTLGARSSPISSAWSPSSSKSTSWYPRGSTIKDNNSSNYGSPGAQGDQGSSTYRSSLSTLTQANSPSSSSSSSTLFSSSRPDVLPNGSIGHSGSGYMSFRDIFNQIAQINDHLYLCSLSAIDSSRLRQLGITLIVSAIVETPPTYAGASGIDVLHIPIEDMEHANIRVYFDRVADRIHQEQVRGGRVLVHCMAGISRSTSLVLAYLVKHQKMSLREAFNHVRSRRSCVQPNVGFWRQLLDFEERVIGSRSVRMVHPGGGAAAYPDVLGRPQDGPASSGTSSGALVYGRHSGVGSVFGPTATRRSNFGTFVNRLY